MVIFPSGSAIPRVSLVNPAQNLRPPSKPTTELLHPLSEGKPIKMSDDPEKPANLPMFYRAPRPVDRARDAHMGLSLPADYRFAAGTNAIPLLFDELPMAAPYYPIVFADGPLPIPAAVVGLQNDQNLFVDPDGK